MPYQRVNDVNLYFEADGVEGPPMVVLHGAMGTIDGDTDWAPLRPSLAGQYRCFFLENRGHGRSDNPAGMLSYRLMADDVEQFILTMGLAPCIVSGMSDGAIVALDLGMRRPDCVAALVCVGANYCNDDSTREANKFADANGEWANDPEMIDLMERLHSRGRGHGHWQELLRQNSENLYSNPSYTLEDLRGIRAPTLLVSGENDRWANFDQMIAMRRSIPGSEMLIVNNAGHPVQATHPDVVGPRMADFLARRLPTAVAR